MKTSALILISAISMTFADSVIAGSKDNISPPAGPYRSISETVQASVKPDTQIISRLQDNQNYSSAQHSQQNKNMPGQYPADLPEWEKQRMAQMQQWMKQQNNQPPAEWMQQRQAQMDQWQQQTNTPPAQIQNRPQWQPNQLPPMQHPGAGPVPLDNRAQQYFPSARGPVYGPGIPPPGFNGQPGYQPAPQQWNPYPAVRR